jgi:hypothetical protein
MLLARSESLLLISPNLQASDRIAEVGKLVPVLRSVRSSATTTAPGCGAGRRRSPLATQLGGGRRRE